MLASVNKEVSTDRWIPTAAKQYTRRAADGMARLGRKALTDGVMTMFLRTTLPVQYTYIFANIAERWPEAFL